MTRRLLAGYLAVTVVVLVLLEVPFGIFYERRETDRFTAAVDRDASVLTTLYEDALEAGGPLDPGPAKRYARRTGARVVVVDRQGISVVDTSRATPRDFSTRPEIATALAGRRATGTRTSRTLNTDLLYVAVPIASSGTVHGALRLTLDTTDVSAQVERFWWRLAAIALVVIAAICLVGWLVARSVTLPVRRLTEAARRFGRGDLTTGIPSDEGPPELRELATTMATMAQELADLLDEQRAFVADASHQLRTPLTGLRLRLENLQAGLDGGDAEQLEAAIDEIDRLSSLVSDLLQLARADRHAEPVAHDLASLARDRVDTWTAVADAAGVSLELTAPGSPLEVSAVPGAIEQILDNLLDNAIGISPPETTVTITVDSDADGAHLIVADRGRGLSDEDKARAIRRFWRGDLTRPGSGLGLAIVDELARASGGAVRLSDTGGGGLTVSVSLPIERERIGTPAS